MMCRQLAQAQPVTGCAQCTTNHPKLCSTSTELSACGRQRPAATATAAALRPEIGVVLEAEVQGEEQVHGLDHCAITVHRHVQ